MVAGRRFLCKKSAWLVGETRCRRNFSQHIGKRYSLPSKHRYGSPTLVKPVLSTTSFGMSRRAATAAAGTTRCLYIHPLCHSCAHLALASVFMQNIVQISTSLTNFSGYYQHFLNRKRHFFQGDIVLSS